jgi:hypothetical protein
MNRSVLSILPSTYSDNRFELIEVIQKHYYQFQKFFFFFFLIISYAFFKRQIFLLTYGSF